jgi:hypothetical protein
VIEIVFEELRALDAKKELLIAVSSLRKQGGAGEGKKPETNRD